MFDFSEVSSSRRSTPTPEELRASGRITIAKNWRSLWFGWPPDCSQSLEGLLLPRQGWPPDCSQSREGLLLPRQGNTKFVIKIFLKELGI